MKSKNNILTEGLSGRINQVVFRQRYGETIVSKRPHFTVASSAAQQQVRISFKEAVIYAKAILSDAVRKRAYQLRAKRGQTAFNLAIADFFKLPHIGDIDTSAYTGQAGSTIRVSVTDDFMVSSVVVCIKRSDGGVVEEGAATLSSDGLHWLYRAATSNGLQPGNFILVTAKDMPGHGVSKQQNL